MSLLFNPELGVADIARLTQLKERERAARANPFTAATFDEEKLKEKERRKADKVAPNWKPTLAIYSETHRSSAVSMVVGQKPVPPAPPAAPATAEAVPAVPPSDAAAEADPHAPESVTAEPRAGEADPLVNVLQRPVQPWRLISARRNMEIGRRTRPDRPARVAAGTKVGRGRGGKVRDVLLLLRGTWLTLPPATRGREHRRNRSRSKSSGASVSGASNHPPPPPSRKHAVNGLRATFEEVSIFSNFLNFFLKFSQKSYFLKFSQIFSNFLKKMVMTLGHGRTLVTPS